jgi:hypothetical protein
MKDKLRNFLIRGVSSIVALIIGIKTIHEIERNINRVKAPTKDEDNSELIIALLFILLILVLFK